MTPPKLRTSKSVQGFCWREPQRFPAGNINHDLTEALECKGVQQLFLVTESAQFHNVLSHGSTRRRFRKGTGTERSRFFSEESR